MGEFLPISYSEQLNESKNWLEQLDLKRKKLSFFQRSLHHNNSDLTGQQQMILNELDSKLSYTADQLIPDLTLQIQAHMRYLECCDSPNCELDSILYSTNHKTYREKVNLTLIGFEQLRNQFVSFIEDSGKTLVRDPEESSRVNS